MKRFFVNKYPVNCGIGNDQRPLLVETGTVFTIIGIVGNFFELEPVSKIDWLTCPVMVDALMLERGFTAQNHITT
jgi:hypothetical protein